MNETSAAYLNLMNRLTSSRANRLRDVANISGQAQMASSQAWGAVPGQVANIALGAMDTYQQQKRMAAQERMQSENIRLRDIAATNDAARTAETGRHNLAIEATGAASAKSAADLAREKFDSEVLEKQVDRFMPVAPGALRQAASDPENYQTYLPQLRYGAQLWNKKNPGNPITIAPEWSNEQATEFLTLANTIEEAYPKKNDVTLSSPGQTGRDASGNVVFTNPDKPAIPGSPEWVATAPMGAVQDFGARNRVAHPPAASTGGDAKPITVEQKNAVERWKQAQLAGLEKQFADVSSGMTVEKLDESKLNVENSYRSQLGLPPVATLAEAGYTQPTPVVAAPPAAPAPVAPATGEFVVTESEVAALASKLNIKRDEARRRLKAGNAVIR